MKLTTQQIEALKTDILTICQAFNQLRQSTVQYLTVQGLNPKDKTLDPFNIYEGGADLTKRFNKDWILAAKICRAKGQLSVMEYAINDYSGFNLSLGGQKIEEVSRAFQWIPGQPLPNKWTGNKFSQSKPQTTLLLSFGCNFDGSIRQVWASVSDLVSHPDGKSGDWRFSANCDRAGFSSLTLTDDLFARPSYQQIIGDVEEDYGISGDAKKGLKLVMTKLA